MTTLELQDEPTPRDGRKWREALHRYVPITAWMPAYPRDFLRGGLIAGVTSWGVMVPVAMAYAQMAAVPAQVGLYTAFAALLGYAVFGTSRQLKVTTSSTMAVMSAAVVGVMAKGDAARYLAVLGKVPGQLATYGDVARHPENERVPGLLIVRLDAPLYFLNANVARSQILELVRAAQSMPHAVLFDLGASADLDVASLDMLRNLVAELEEAGSDVLLAQVRGSVRDRLRHSGIMAEIGENRVYRSVAAAVYDFERREGLAEA